MHGVQNYCTINTLLSEYVLEPLIIAGKTYVLVTDGL